MSIKSQTWWRQAAGVGKITEWCTFLLT